MGKEKERVNEKKGQKFGGGEGTLENENGNEIWGETNGEKLGPCPKGNGSWKAWLEPCWGLKGLPGPWVPEWKKRKKIGGKN